MVGYWDADLLNRAANKAYVEFFGLTPRQMRGMHIRDVLGPELYELNRPYMGRALAGDAQLFDRTIVDAAGVTHHTQASYIPDVIDGEVRGFSVLVTDITARRRAEEARAVAEARFRLAFTGSPVGMAMIDGAGRLLALNPSLCTTFGVVEDEQCGRSFRALVGAASADDAAALIEGLLSGDGASSSSEWQLTRRDGATRWVLISLALADGETGEDTTLAIAHVQDITARKTIEEDLERSRAQLAEAEQIALMGSWEWDPATGLSSWSDGMLRLHGLHREEFDPVREAGELRVFPEDRPRVLDVIRDALTDRAPFLLEYRAVRADGRVRTLLSRGEVIVDDTGEAARIVGIARDITEERIGQPRETGPAVPDAGPARPIEVLTVRQLEILTLVARGRTSAAIARELLVSEATVKWHVKQILVRTGAASRAEAVARVFGSGPGA